MVFAADLGPYTLATVLVAATSILFALRQANRRLDLRLGNIHATVSHVNEAVNNQAEGEPRLIDRVIRLEEQSREQFLEATRGREGLHRDMLLCANDIRRVASRVDQHLAAHQEDRERSRLAESGLLDRRHPPDQDDDDVDEESE